MHGKPIFKLQVFTERGYERAWMFSDALLACGALRVTRVGLSRRAVFAAGRYRAAAAKRFCSLAAERGNVASSPSASYSVTDFAYFAYPVCLVLPAARLRLTPLPTSPTLPTQSASCCQLLVIDPLPASPTLPTQPATCCQVG